MKEGVFKKHPLMMSENEMETAVSEHIEKMDEEYLKEKLSKFGYSDKAIEREIQRINLGREQRLYEEKAKEAINHSIALKLNDASNFFSSKISFNENEAGKMLRLVS